MEGILNLELRSSYHSPLFFYLFVSLIDGHEFFFGGFTDVFAHVSYLIWMVFHGHIPVSFFDLIVGGGALYTQDMVG